MSSANLCYNAVPHRIFRPFTRESMASMQVRIAERQRLQRERENMDLDEMYQSHQQEELHPDKLLEAGLILPRYLERDFPSELIGTPIEDIDKYYEKVGIPTFVVISKGKDIFRFSATKALFLLSPFNPIRRVSIFMLVHPWFSLLVITTILANCLMMTMQNENTEKTEIIFTTIYTFESCLKVTARGFILTEFTYLRDPWNWLDFIVIALAYLTMCFEYLGNLSSLRTFRVLRALKTISVIPGLKTIVGALIEAAKNLKDVTILTCFSLSVFALLGLQIYMGSLTQKCIIHGPKNMTNQEWYNWCNDTSHWVNFSDGRPMLCSNTSGATLCNSTMSTCIQGFGPNPNYGYTNYDTFPWALLSAFRLLTQDYWESLYQMILRTNGPWHVLYFIGAIFLGSIYLVNLILAIVAMSYDELQKKMADEDTAAAAEEAAYQDTLRGQDTIRGDPRLSATGGGGGGEGDESRQYRGNSIVRFDDGPYLPPPPAYLHNAQYDNPIAGYVRQNHHDPRVYGGIDPGGGVIVCQPHRRTASEYSEDDKSVSSGDNKERMSIKSIDEQLLSRRARVNGKIIKSSSSLPGSPHSNSHQINRSSQFSVSNWSRNGLSQTDGSDRKPLVPQNYLEAQDFLPFADDSQAVTPMSEDNGAIIIPVTNKLLSRHSSYTSHSSRISYTSHGDFCGARANLPWTKEKHLPTRRDIQDYIQEAEQFDENEYTGILPFKRPVDPHNPFLDGKNGPNSNIDIKDVMVLNDIIDQAAGHRNKSSERVSIYHFPTERDEIEEDDRPAWKQQITTCCLKSIDILCVWDCCWCWVKVQEMFAQIVFDPFMELFITLCIVVNTLFMAMDHHGMDADFQAILNNGNLFFSGTFAIEAIMKLIAISPKFYFRESWNVFDFIIVALSFLELFLANVSGLSVLRTFRLLRVFKLAKSWPTLNLLISIMGKTLGDLANLTIVLSIIVFIFAVMGMQLFGATYMNSKQKFHGGDLPRWNFSDFMHSFMIVFRVLCGEWIESMWDCIHVCGFICVPFFLATVVIGHLVMLNLFLALLLSSFGASNLSSPTSESADTKKLQEAFDRFARAHKWLKNRILSFLKSLSPKTRNQIAVQRPARIARMANTMDMNDGQRIGIGGESSDTTMTMMPMIDGQGPIRGTKNDYDLLVGDDIGDYGLQSGKMSFKSSARSVINSVKLSQAVKELQRDKLFLADHAQFIGNQLRNSLNMKDSTINNQQMLHVNSITTGDTIVDRTNQFKLMPSNNTGNLIALNGSSLMLNRGDETDKGDKYYIGMCEGGGGGQMPETDEDMIVEDADANKMVTVTADISPADHPDDCLPDYWYERFPCCLEETPFWMWWRSTRSKCYKLVEDKYFETLVITLILLSSMTLAVEDANLKERPWLEHSLKYIDQFFTIIFSMEMVLKWIAYGFRSYFSNAWCWLDFVIVMVSMINLIVGFLGFSNIPAFKTMRTLRALRPLRAMSRLEGMRVVVNALVHAIPAIFNVLLVCLIFWLIFAIMGVQLFSGRFSYCRDKITEERSSADVIANKSVCLQYNQTLEWFTPMINFDHVLNGYLSLFQVATFKGWTLIMDYAIDSREPGQQPMKETNIYMYLYFVFFIICGSFFTLNLFIGVIIDNFNEQKKKSGGSREMLMTEDQKKYLNAMKKMGNKKPMKAIPRPRLKLQAMVFDIVTNKKFDMIIMGFIMLNMLVMALDHYGASQFTENILESCNLFFIAIFTAECLLKLFALRYYYFREPWNIFDFIIVILSIAGSTLKDLIENYFFSPTLLRVVRVVKIGRVLRLVKGARGIRTLLFALAMSLPALFNICLLLFLVIFIYAIFGMSFFMNVKKRWGLDDTFNFGTFFKSFILLFQMCTSAGWSDVLAGIMDESKCEKDLEVTDCGNRKIAIAYLCTYLVISFLVIINMYIAVILENYSQATEDVQEGLTDDDYDMYYEIWQRYDPDGTQFIPYSALSDFLDALEEPLRVPKPNKFKIIQMDIPICVNDMCYCVEILDILTREFFVQKGKAIEDTPELEEVLPLKGRYEHISGTFKRQREEYCARLIQQIWRRYKASKSNPDGNHNRKFSITSKRSSGKQSRDFDLDKDGHKIIVHTRSSSIVSRLTDA
ncbi:sodium voltage-gated channel paralytic isoform X1 [Brevipalpus obovatus]|uniref:sodium voltage-gated channel paralytic isoform X1 n=1 Tax=Brevipalpus obovatus TaxID=246614 RepID=UPI003D9F2732